MADAIERFEREYIAYHRITRPRAQQQVKLLRELESRIDGEITEATFEDFSTFAGTLVGTYHVNTVRKKLNMIRPFFAWCYAAGLITGDQWLRLKQVKDPRGASSITLPKPYTRKEMIAFWADLERALPLLPTNGVGSQALRRWIQGRGLWARLRRHAMRLQIEAMVKLALHGGLRRAEIFRLKLDDLHYDNEYIVVVGKADPQTGEPKVREVPFTGPMRDAMYTWLEFRALLRPTHDSPWLSLWGPDTHANPMTWETFSELLKDQIGGSWTWHRFRHTCATEWLRAGVALETVSTLLGHATLQQTLAYAKIAKSDVARAMGKRESDFSQAVDRAAA